MNSTAVLYAIQPFTPSEAALYNLNEAAHLAGLPRHFVVVCWKHGLVAAQVDSTYGGMFFDAHAIRGLRRIAYLHQACGVNLTGIKIIVELIDEIDRLKGEPAMEAAY